MIHKLLTDIEAFVFDHPTVCMAFLIIGLLETPIVAISVILLYLLTRIIL